MGEKLTDRSVAALRCPAGREAMVTFDDALPGFGVKVRTGGGAVFILDYQAPGPTGWRTRRVTLGRFGELTTAEARKKAEVLRGQVRDKKDPVAERRAQQAVTVAAEAQAKAAAAAATYTVDVLISDWERLHLAERSASYRRRMPRDMRVALADWLLVPAGSLAREDAVRVLDTVKVEHGPISANRLQAVARACWGWAMKRGALDRNPWTALPRPSREVARERVLSDAELAVIWQAAENLGEPFVGIVRMMMLTGQRRGEVAGMRWDELDLDTGTWALPGERTKNGRAHSVPLPPAALDILAAAGKLRRRGAVLVFEGIRRTVPSGFGKPKATLDAALVGAAKATGRKAAPWVLHDLRRTVATGLQRLGVRLEVTEALLNHVSGSRSGIVGVYQRHGWEREKIAAAEAWTAHLMRAIKGEAEGDNVVALAAVQGRDACRRG